MINISSKNQIKIDNYSSKVQTNDIQNLSKTISNKTSLTKDVFLSFKGKEKSSFDFSKFYPIPSCISGNLSLDRKISAIVDDANLMNYLLLKSLAKNEEIKLGIDNKDIDPTIIPLIQDNWADIKNYIASNVIDNLIHEINNPHAKNDQENNKNIIFQYLRIVNELDIIPTIAEEYILPKKQKNSPLSMLKKFFNGSKDKIHIITEKLLSPNLPKADLIRKQYIDMAYNILNRDLDSFSDWDNSIGKEKAQIIASKNALDTICRLGNYIEEAPKLAELYNNDNIDPQVKRNILGCLKNFYYQAQACINSFNTLLSRRGSTGIDYLSAQKCMENLAPVLKINSPE